jgi:hypothetical protein
MPKTNKLKLFKRTKKNKKINKHRNKTHKSQHFQYRNKTPTHFNLKKNKRGGFPSWSDISNWRPDFTSWKSGFADKFRNFSIFKKKNQQPIAEDNSSYADVPEQMQPEQMQPEQTQMNEFQQQPPTSEQIQPPTLEQPPEQIQPPEQMQPPTLEQPTYSPEEQTRQLGGYRGYHSLTNLASKSAPFWQPTAKPQVWVGGKTKHKKRNSKKTKKSKKTY